MKYLRILLISVPLSFVGYFMNWNATTMFILACIAIIPLAGYLGSATESIAVYTGPKAGGFLNATFGNATELIISFFAIRAGLFDVVKATLAGSVLGNILLVLGCSILAGGLKHKVLKYDAKLGRSTATMLLFAVVALAMPAVFTAKIQEDVIVGKYMTFSIITSIIMLITYVVGVIYSFKSQNDLYDEKDEEEEAQWSLIASTVILAVATILIAVESEFLVGSIEPMTEAAGISQMFIGIILIPIVGNAAEHSTAIIMALKNKMDIAIEIAVGSSLQIVLFVIPISVIMSLFISETPMSIVFKAGEIFLFGASVFIVNHIVKAGRTDWMEGLKLISVYIIAAVGFFMIG
ncbi:calcium/proton exchanger [Kineothrix sp. MB12-C1]|uniref:calcium/proton exchanger n=1 Tax=Kineothrix sp. MB12-C1 TaxID=3070215 RepID=UPI0027D26C55|nr:calcium/proton exchanger [Kineothrix sp. MB12-C1]WMC92825.1 calcium/proton exchanger [Kineothrix sp. MB12-C1]